MAKMYAGNIPTEGGWEQVSKYNDHFGTEWLIFRRKQSHSEDWVNYKVVANGRTRNKANYWFTYNHASNRIGFSRDYMLMRENRPELYEHLEKMLRSWWAAQECTPSVDTAKNQPISREGGPNGHGD